ncbi:hypothetical protein RhiirC2_844318 [Rhizophagus irregularis]|uniref:Uncharacterized protein n=1 Tax=Rhizophagus irregularis TaxID=588596 RepID=A0A2N1NU97_9GLOM|nr:hypothetical protein RhiirC2_844318 [Rhizophagus irregularis]
MASFLLSECLEKIFLNFIKEHSFNDIGSNIPSKELFSCTLVSRHWCRISTPLLYSYPFHHFRHKTSYNSFYKLIRTLLCCVPQTEIIQLLKNNNNNNNNNNNQFYKIKSNNTVFNYISLIRGLIVDELMFKSQYLIIYKEIWLSSYNPRMMSTDLIIKIMNYFVKFLCKNLNNLTILEFPFTMKNNDIIELLTIKDCNGKSKLSDLKELYYINSYISRDSNNNINNNNNNNNNNNLNNEILLPKSLYFTLTNTICNLNLLYNKRIKTIEEANYLSQFISIQKNLKHIILSENRYYLLFYSLDRLFYSNSDNKYNIVLSSLSTQSESLQILEFKNLYFGDINTNVIKSLSLLKNIRILKLYKCRKINDNLHSWAKNLSKLEIFELVERYYTNISEDFLIQLIHSSSNTLIKLVINYERVEKQGIRLFQNFPTLLISLKYLELPKIFLNELIFILKSCIKLNFLSIILSNDDLFEENLKNLANFLPKTLKRIRFRETNCSIISINSLNYFLFESILNSGCNLKYLEFNDSNGFDQDYINLTKHYGVELVKI